MYSNMKLYNEIKAEMVNVMEAETNAKAWRDEVAFRMRDVNTLIAAAQKVNKDITIDRKELIAEIRADLTKVEEVAPAEIPDCPDNDEEVISHA